jgi:hypothetical protein
VPLVSGSAFAEQFDSRTPSVDDRGPVTRTCDVLVLTCGGTMLRRHIGSERIVNGQSCVDVYTKDIGSELGYHTWNSCGVGDFLLLLTNGYI